jgi:hypothetical protein
VQTRAAKIAQRLINGHGAPLYLTHREATFRYHVIDSLIEVRNRVPVFTRALLKLPAAAGSLDMIGLLCEMGEAIVDGPKIPAGAVFVVVGPRKVHTLSGCAFDDGGVEPLPDSHAGTPCCIPRGFLRARANALDIPWAAKHHHLTPSGPRHVPDRRPGARHGQ